jgi:hypothetical protein
MNTQTTFVSRPRQIRRTVVRFAMAAGAQGDDVAVIAQKMIEMQSIKPATATSLLQQIHVLAS